MKSYSFITSFVLFKINFPTNLVSIPKTLFCVFVFSFKIFLLLEHSILGYFKLIIKLIWFKILILFTLKFSYSPPSPYSFFEDHSQLIVTIGSF